MFHFPCYICFVPFSKFHFSCFIINFSCFKFHFPCFICLVSFFMFHFPCFICLVSFFMLHVSLLIFHVSFSFYIFFIPLLGRSPRHGRDVLCQRRQLHDLHDLQVPHHPGRDRQLPVGQRLRGRDGQPRHAHHAHQRRLQSQVRNCLHLMVGFVLEPTWFAIIPQTPPLSTRNRYHAVQDRETETETEGQRERERGLLLMSGREVIFLRSRGRPGQQAYSQQPCVCVCARVIFFIMQLRFCYWPRSVVNQKIRG